MIFKSEKKLKKFFLIFLSIRKIYFKGKKPATFGQKLLRAGKTAIFSNFVQK